MAALDPVPWDDIEAVTGPLAPGITACIDDHANQLAEKPPYDTVKTIHDALAAPDGPDSTVPDQGEIFITAYLLEQRGLLGPAGQPASSASESPSITERRPNLEELEALFWERERTMWWIALRTGVHWALVRYWLAEDDIPLRERNFSAETLAEIREHQETSG